MTEPSEKRALMPPVWLASWGVREGGIVGPDVVVEDRTLAGSAGLLPGAGVDDALLVGNGDVPAGDVVAELGARQIVADGGGAEEDFELVSEWAVEEEAAATLEREVPDTVGGGFCRVGGGGEKAIVIFDVDGGGGGDLMELSGALGASGGAAGRAQGGHEQGEEEGDDADDNHQLNERKRFA